MDFAAPFAERAEAGIIFGRKQIGQEKQERKSNEPKEQEEKACCMGAETGKCDNFPPVPITTG